MARGNKKLHGTYTYSYRISSGSQVKFAFKKTCPSIQQSIEVAFVQGTDLSTSIPPVLVVDFFWAVVALQMWRLPIQPPVQRSRPPGEPQDPTLRQRNPWLKSCNLLVVMLLDHCISEVPTWMTNVLSSNGNGWQTLSMFCDLMFSSPFPEDLGSGAASSSPFTMEIWHPIGSPYPATSQNISRGGWMMGIDGAYPLIRLAFTKNSGLRINRSMIFTIPGKNRCTEAGIHIYIYIHKAINYGYLFP